MIGTLIEKESQTDPMAILDSIENMVVLGLKDISQVKLVEASKMQDLFLDILTEIKTHREG